MKSFFRIFVKELVFTPRDSLADGPDLIDCVAAFLMCATAFASSLRPPKPEKTIEKYIRPSMQVAKVYCNQLSRNITRNMRGEQFKSHVVCITNMFK